MTQSQQFRILASSSQKIHAVLNFMTMRRRILVELYVREERDPT
jgi:hypothetical protein